MAGCGGVEVWRCGGKLVRGQYYSKRNSKRLRHRGCENDSLYMCIIGDKTERI